MNPRKLARHDAIEQDPWIQNIGLGLERTNVVDLVKLRSWYSRNPNIPFLGLVLRSTLMPFEVSRKVREARTLARRLEKVDALEKRGERARRAKR